MYCFNNLRVSIRNRNRTVGGRVDVLLNARAPPARARLHRTRSGIGARGHGGHEQALAELLERIRLESRKSCGEFRERNDRW